jgi:hypothetical protein
MIQIAGAVPAANPACCAHTRIPARDEAAVVRHAAEEHLGGGTVWNPR